MGRHEQQTTRRRLLHPLAYGAACVVLGGAVVAGFSALGATGSGTGSADQSCTFAVVNGQVDGAVLHCTTPTTPPPTSSAPTTPAPTTAPPTTTSPTPTPTPTPTQTPPPVSGWPGPSNTGVPKNIHLAASGSVTASTAGETINGLDITGTVTVRAKNVIIENTLINAGNSTYAITVSGGGSVTVQDSEIVGSSQATTYDDNVTLIRDNIHGFHGDGLKVGSNDTIEDSWIHDAATTGGTHCDGIQAQDGVSNVIIKHNSIDPDESGSNSAVFIKDDLGPASNGPVLIDDNLLGGGGYTLYVYKGSSGLAQGGVTVENNRFLNDEKYHPVAVNIPVVAWSGNVQDNNNAVVNP